MKILKKLGAIMAVSLAISLVVPNVVPVMNTMVEAKTTYINGSEKTTNIFLNIGDNTRKLKLKNISSKVKWTSYDKSVATINSKGVVTAIRAGKTKIIATAGKEKFSCTINVNIPSFNSKLRYLCLEEQLKLEVKKCTLPILWESEDNTIATVEVDGTITGRAVGKTNINAIINDTKYPYAITVEDPKILPNLEISTKIRQFDLSTILSGTERKDIWWSADPGSVDVYGGILTTWLPDAAVVTVHFGAGSGGRTLSCNVTIY